MGRSIIKCAKVILYYSRSCIRFSMRYLSIDEMLFKWRYYEPMAVRRVSATLDCFCIIMFDNKKAFGFLRDKEVKCGHCLIN